MAGYTQRWDCRICTAETESDGVPKHGICEACLDKLAGVLCYQKMSVFITDEGVDRAYWMREAELLVNPLFRGWVARQPPTNIVTDEFAKRVVYGIGLAGAGSLEQAIQRVKTALEQALDPEKVLPDNAKLVKMPDGNAYWVGDEETSAGQHK